MNDPIPSVQPVEKSCCGSSMGPFLIGLVVGAGVVGAAATAFILKERTAHQRALAETAQAQAALTQAGQLMQGAIGTAFNVAGTPPVAVAATGATIPAVAETIKKLGDESVDDLRQARTLAVYRHATKEYQKKVSREDFDKMMAEVQNLRYMHPDPRLRESKVTKAAEGEGYEYYCSSGGNSFNGIVNFAFTFVPAEGGGWLISDVQASFTAK
jgi:hypothetical protein